MEEGTVLRWFARVGDRVKAGEVLFELETDKATLEVEAEQPGRLARVLVGEGQTAPVQAVVAYLAESEEDLKEWLTRYTEPPGPAKAVAEAVAEVSPGPAVVEITPETDTKPHGRRKASPAARNAAKALGVDLDTIATGSGPGGRVLVEDVERAAQGRSGASSQAGAVRRAPMSRMRKAIAKNLSASKATIPHWYATVTVEADALLEFVKRQKERFECSVNDAVLLACAKVLEEMPEFRSQVDGEDIVTYESSNLGFAVALEEGLVVPVLRGAERLSLEALAREVRRLAQAARAGRLEGVGEGVFTVSNLGMYGVEEFAAIVNPPESGILAVGAIVESVVVRDGAMRLGRTMKLTLSADHRLIDGTTSAKFLARLKQLLEQPQRLGV